MQAIYDIYGQFLSYFPENTHGIISLFLAGLLVIGILKVIKKDFIYIILLVVLLPASIPILEKTWQQIVELLKFLINSK